MKKGGKPPPESWTKIKNTGASDCIDVRKDRKRTMLLTDGAKCYPTMSAHVGVLHSSVNHSLGQ